MTGLSPNVAANLRVSPHRVVVTGCSGWLGRATLELLRNCLGEAFDRRVAGFGSSRRRIELANGETFEQRPLAELSQLDPRPTLLLHFAFLTKDRAEQMDEPAYRAANAAISRTVLDALGPIGVEAAFVASSGAAASTDNPDASPAMRLYGSLKRADEDAFAAWARQSKRRVAIGRIHNLSGPHINKLESYALASFIVDALGGGPIRVLAPHGVVRGYVAIRELMSLAFALLLDTNPGVIRFDSGGEPVELGELAEVVARRFPECRIERPPRIDGSDRYVGDDRGYRALLTAAGIKPVPLARQVLETADYLAARRPNS
jgi:nucleoside-diphosphate-sugar epimerase